MISADEIGRPLPNEPATDGPIIAPTKPIFWIIPVAVPTCDSSTLTCASAEGSLQNVFVTKPARQETPPLPNTRPGEQERERSGLLTSRRPIALLADFFHHPWLSWGCQ